MAMSMTVSSLGQTIITFSSLSGFNTAIGAGPVTVEDFTSSNHFPIITGILNSLTNLVVTSGPAITPGLIQPGVTYSTPVGSGNFFNIDSGGGFTGGFLDTVTSNGPLTITFAGPVSAFGFDTSTIVGPSFAITINFTSGSPYTNTFSTVSTVPSFYGFQSTSTNISSVIVGGGTTQFTFAIDNFRFTSVPEPGTVWLMGGGVALLAVLYRRRAI